MRTPEWWPRNSELKLGQKLGSVWNGTKLGGIWQDIHILLNLPLLALSVMLP